MSSPTFHLFPKLAYDLRLLIWEASCFNGNKTTRHGLNYVNLTHDGLFSGYLHYRPAEESETSSCLMGTGLWGACVESRAVMIKQFRKRGLSLDDIPALQNRGRWLSGSEHIRSPVMVSRHDLFCFRISNWFEQYRPIPRFYFYLPRYKGIVEAQVCNLAFELDIAGQGTPHIVWYTIRCAIREAHPQVRRKRGETLNLSIIDKDVHWYRDNSTVNVNVTYADSDSEYTIVSWENLCYCDQVGVGTGAHALRKNVTPSHGEDSANFYRRMERTVKVLVRRDNEVSCPLEQRVYRSEDHQSDPNWMSSVVSGNISNQEAEDNEEEEEDRRNRKLESLPVCSPLSESTARQWYAPYRK
ncbi:hypothetical protein NW768_007722 [Fusarium equiseti]|uniref:2EXR domain-containing protein n=1 Tax=Fusarium equiseti TaxID=61235 RepID=A0ABQ8R8B5_FUSEQ|nr:hypothetical protein NW768_007722 [Fusarium equiseti]